MDSNPKLGFAFRTAVERGKKWELTAEDIIAKLGKSPKKSSVRKVPTPSGPFPFQLYFEDLAEIDEICLEALERQSLLPSNPAPIRIERFVEKEFKTALRYEDLGPDNLGCTIFNHRTGGNRSTSPETTFGAKTSVLNMANSDLCDHSRGLNVRFFPFRERMPCITSFYSVQTKSGTISRRSRCSRIASSSGAAAKRLAASSTFGSIPM